MRVSVFKVGRNIHPTIAIGRNLLSVYGNDVSLLYMLRKRENVSTLPLSFRDFLATIKGEGGPPIQIC